MNKPADPFNELYRDRALVKAAKLGHHKVLRELLRQTKPLHLKSLLVESANYGRVKCLDLLIDYFKPEQHQLNEALLSSSYLRNSCVADYLVDKGANIDCQDGHKRTPLIIACRHRFSIKVVELIGLGADVNRQDVDGMTALMNCTDNEKWRVSLNIIKQLMDANADLFLQNNQGYTALDLAIKHNNIDVVQLLSAYEDQKKLLNIMDHSINESALEMLL